MTDSIAPAQSRKSASEQARAGKPSKLPGNWRQLRGLHPQFPLFPHQSGRWAKKVRGKVHYFGKIADDPKGEAAASLWAEQKDDLTRGALRGSPLTA